MKFLLALVTCCLSISGWSQNFQPTDEGSSVTFKIKNFGLTVQGSFTGLRGKIQFDSNDLPASRFDVSIKATSINTGIDLRDKHLRKKEYFNVEHFSEIRFISTRVEASSKPGTYLITARLTLKKTTKEINFEFTAEKQDGGYLFRGEFPLNRRDYEIGGSSFSMSDVMTVFLDVKVLAGETQIRIK